jgi:ribA/ribD-fused uncharacterized protein
MTPKVIKFYYPNEPYGEFSNFYVRPIVVNNANWPVGTESFFQAMKSLDPDIQEYVRTKIQSPGRAKRYCTEEVTLRPDWETSVELIDKQREMFTDDQGVVVDLVKDHFMYQAVAAKFTQHLDLAKLLLSTGKATIIEDTQKVGSDPYWGNGPSANGLNKLGRMLMLVRKTLPRHLEK